MLVEESGLRLSILIGKVPPVKLSKLTKQSGRFNIAMGTKDEPESASFNETEIMVSFRSSGS